MLRAGRQRGVLRRAAFQQPSQFLQFRFHRRQLGHQRPNDGLCLKRLTSNLIFRERQRHALGVTEPHPPCLDQHPQAVNAYTVRQKLQASHKSVFEQNCDHEHNARRSRAFEQGYDGQTSGEEPVARFV